MPGFADLHQHSTSSNGGKAKIPLNSIQPGYIKFPAPQLKRTSNNKIRPFTGKKCFINFPLGFTLMENRSRIEILDGLRVLAIMMVMIFHFYARYQGKYYTYDFKVPSILIHGRLGVQLFFVISGFVITLTLAKSKTFLEFMTKRLIRLLPGMVICATFTFIFFLVFDKNNLIPQCKSIYNLLLSFTFISPALVNKILGTDLQYIDGSYWTIWTELQFYVLAGIIYFLSPKNFMRNYLVLVALTFPAVQFFIHPYFTGQASELFGTHAVETARNVLKVFNLFIENCWFLAGIILNKIHYGKAQDRKLLLLFAGIFVVEMLVLSNIQITFILLTLLSIFLLFIYKPTYLAFLSNRTLSKVGVASYSIYLIHEYNGYLIMDRLAPSFGSYNWLIPVSLIVISTYFAIWSYKYLETPAMEKLKRLLLRRKPGGVADSPRSTSQPDEPLSIEQGI
jgi:peptidoglycan/LPS O-acetylase OafA/YrhL